MTKKIIAYVLAGCMMLALAACAGGTGSQPAPSPTGEAPPAPPAETRSARDQIYEIMERDPVRFSGIPPRELADRSHIPKAAEQDLRGNLSIGMCMAYLGAAFFHTMHDTFRELVEAEGHSLQLQISERNIEVAGQQVDAYISQGVDFIFMHGPAQSYTPNYRRAAEAGIPVVATSNQIAEADGNQITLFISNSYAAGFNVGEYTARQLYEPGKEYPVAFVLNQVGTGDTETRGNAFTAGFLYGLAELDGNPYPSVWEAMLEAYSLWDEFMSRGRLHSPEHRINYLGYGQGETPDAPGGLKAANDLITAHGQTMEILFIESCDMYRGGADVVLRQHNIVPGQDVQLVSGGNATRVSMEALMAGEYLAIGYNSSSMIALGAMAVLNGIFVEGDPRMNNLVANTYLPGPVVHIDNVHEFYDPNLELAKPFPVELITVTEYNAAMSDTAPPF